MSDVTERPLVTFVLFAYNQERYVREAVEGALAQDYSPLEIILSDDCSSDSTFEIMRELAASHSGPHVVRLNRNNSNLGVGGHINVLMKMVSADFVVAGAGDDISEPTRVTKLTDVWRNSDGKVLSVHSSALIISEDGSLLGEQRKGSEDSLLNCLDAHAATFLSVLGATHAWDMRLIREFDPILDKVINEDVVTFDPGKKYDFIISISTLEHVGFSYGEKEDPKKFLKGVKNLVRLLKPGGALFATFPAFLTPGIDSLLSVGNDTGGGSLGSCL